MAVIYNTAIFALGTMSVTFAQSSVAARIFSTMIAIVWCSLVNSVLLLAPRLYALWQFGDEEAASRARAQSSSSKKSVSGMSSVALTSKRNAQRADSSSGIGSDSGTSATSEADVDAHQVAVTTTTMSATTTLDPVAWATHAPVASAVGEKIVDAASGAIIASAPLLATTAMASDESASPGSR